MFVKAHRARLLFPLKQHKRILPTTRLHSHASPPPSCGFDYAPWIKDARDFILSNMYIKGSACLGMCSMKPK